MEPSVDNYYYLFNTKGRMFFKGANDYNTRASIAITGYKVRFSEDEATNEPGALLFTDSVETQEAWKAVFATPDATAIWVDNSSEAYRFWFVIPTENKTYRISNPVLTEDNFLGWKGSEDDTRLYLLKDTVGNGIDWVFVSEANYLAWQELWASMKDQYEAAAELLTIIKNAEEQGIDVTAETQVYLNEDASVEEIKNAISSIYKKINEKLAGNASVANPSDMTKLLINPNFDDASNAGWSGTAPNMTGDGNHAAANVAEHYNKTFDTYQKFSQMLPGVYKLSANAFLRGAWDDHANKVNYVAKLYAEVDNDTMSVDVQNAWDAMNTASLAGDGTTYFGTPNVEESQEHDGVTYFIPNNPSTGRIYFENGFYKNNLYFTLDGDSTKLGIRKDKNVYGWDWVVFDSFSLTYYGNATDAYQFCLDSLRGEKKEYSEYEVSTVYRNAYDAAFALTASNSAEVKAGKAVFDAAVDSVNANIAMWAKLKAKVTEANSIATTYDYVESAQDLGDYISFGPDEETDLNSLDDAEKEWTNEYLQSVIDTLDRMMQQVVDDSKNYIKPGSDVTYYLTNPDFEANGGSNTGWTVVSKGGGNVQLGGTSANHCYEAWHSTNFDVYQEVRNLPLGVYDIEVQGYVRYLDGGSDKQNNPAINAKDESYNLFAAGVPIYVYMNDSKANLVNWFSYPKPTSFYDAVSGASYLYEDEDNAYPDNMIAASAAFADGGYKQSAKGLVAEENSVMRIGVKGTPEAKFWPIFDNFKLTYLGFDVEVVKPVLEEKLTEAAKWEDTMTTKDAREAFNTTFANAQAALNETDGKAMFDCLAELTKVINQVEVGAGQTEALQAALTELLTLAESAVSSVASDALTYATDVLSRVESSDVASDEIEGINTMIREYTLKIQLPENYAEGNGADVTAFIQTPDFEKTLSDGSKTNAIDGWEGSAGYNFGNDATQKAALALEFYEKTFDMYQELEGVGEVQLPNGWYKLSVNAFERVNSSTPAYLYAVSGENNVEQELMTLEAGVDTEAGESTPNDMVTAVGYFENGKYLNELAIQVTDNKLRIGLKHENYSQYDWIIMDNFKLLYYADEKPTAVENISTALGKAVTVQYFTLDGRRVNTLQKGITIRKTIMDNGTVIVRKIRK